MKIETLVPQRGRLELRDLLGRLAAEPGTAHPFDEARIACLDRLSKRVMRHPALRRDPAMVSLGYWMRPANVERLRGTLDADGRHLRVARGTVFQIAPANVGTVFAYCWLLSFVVGNRTVIRVSSESDAIDERLVTLIAEVVADDPEVAGSTWAVRYGHDDDVTAALSAIADVRMIWGGDETVSAIRRFPLPAHGVDIPFHDRSSLSVIDVDAYLALDEAGRRSLASGMFNDVYWFDQLACSSPRVLLWCSRTAAAVAVASDDFGSRLHETVSAKGYRLDTPAAVAKLVYQFRAALDLPVVRRRAFGNETVALTVDGALVPPVEHCGSGLLFEGHITAVDDLLPLLERRHQTLTYFGVPLDELTRFVRAARGRGVDRIVPIGTALDFDHVWDGFDLLAELTRVVQLSPPSAPRGVT